MTRAGVKQYVRTARAPGKSLDRPGGSRMRFTRSLRGRLAIIVAIAIVVSGTMVLLFGFFMARSSMRQEIFESLEGVVARTGKEVRASLTRLGSAANAVASRQEIRRGLASFADGSGDREALAAELDATLGDVRAAVPAFDRLLLASSDGDAVARAPADRTAARGVAPGVLAEAAFGRTAYDFTVRDGKVVLVVAEPVYGPESALAGVLVLESGAEELERELRDNAGLGEQGRILLSKRSGGEVLSLVPPVASGGFRLTTVGGGEDRPAAMAAGGRTGEGQARGPDGRDVIYSFDHIPEASWGIYVTEDGAEALAPIYHLRNVNILVIVVLLIGGCLLAYLIASSISRPLEQLQDGVRALASPDMGTRVSIRDGVEVTALANEFNAMAGRLDELYRTLEQKVEERTRELQEANERLKVLDELKSEFVSMASHELRSPLSSMKMGVATVAREMVGPLNDEQRQMLQIAERNIDRLTRLTTDLLDLTKIEAGQLDLELHDNDVREIAVEVADVSAPLAGEKGLYLRVAPGTGDTVAPSDRDRLYQVLENLVNNAINFTDEGGVTVAVERRGDRVVASVSDTGIGIPPQVAGTVFDKWSRAHSETRSEKRGTGLGLAICKGIVEAHGGSISVESETGGGSTFRFTVPAGGPGERE